MLCNITDNVIIRCLVYISDPALFFIYQLINLLHLSSFTCWSVYLCFPKFSHPLVFTATRHTTGRWPGSAFILLIVVICFYNLVTFCSTMLSSTYEVRCPLTCYCLVLRFKKIFTSFLLIIQHFLFKISLDQRKFTLTGTWFRLIGQNK